MKDRSEAQLPEYTRKQLETLLDGIAHAALTITEHARHNAGQPDAYYRAIGAISYQIWEARQRLGMPDMPGLDPLGSTRYRD